jgi:hypothetical protein
MIKDKIQGQDIMGLRLTGPGGEVKDNRLVADGDEVVSVSYTHLRAHET